MQRWVAGVMLGVGGWALAAQPPGTLPSLVVEAGERARQSPWVSVTLPPSVRGVDLQLRAADGRVLPLQVGPDRQAWAIVPDIASNGRATFAIEPALRSTARDAIVVRQEGSHRRIERDGRPVLRYVGEPLGLPDGVGELLRRGGYIHPVQTPTGVQVTEDYPPNHQHHHGIWAAWAHTRVGTRAPDFWNMGDGTGRVEFESNGTSWSGPLTGGFQARHRYVDLTTPSPTTVLTEQWTVTAFATDLGSQPAHVFDLVVMQRLVGDTPLDLPPYRYGGLGLRGRHLWDGADKTHVLTAGGRDRLAGHATRATWVHMGGDVDGRRVGIAVLGHPDNLRSPQPMRIHPAEPFIAFAPQQAGPARIAPGDTFVMRYRFVATDGPPDARALDDMWQEWATPVTARVR